MGGIVSLPMWVNSTEPSKRICFEKQLASQRYLDARQPKCGADFEKITMMEILGFLDLIRLPGS